MSDILCTFYDYKQFISYNYSNKIHMLYPDMDGLGESNVWNLGDACRETSTFLSITARDCLNEGGQCSNLNEYVCRITKLLFDYTCIFSNGQLATIIRHPLCLIERRVFGWGKIFNTLIGWTGLFKNYFNSKVHWVASRDQIEGLLLSKVFPDHNVTSTIRSIYQYYKSHFGFGPCLTDRWTWRMKYLMKYHLDEHTPIDKFLGEVSFLMACIWRTYFTKKSRSDTTINLTHYKYFITGRQYTISSTVKPSWIVRLAIKIFNKRSVVNDWLTYYKNSPLKLYIYGRDYISQ